MYNVSVPNPAMTRNKVHLMTFNSFSGESETRSQKCDVEQPGLIITMRIEPQFMALNIHHLFLIHLR